MRTKIVVAVLFCCFANWVSVADCAESDEMHRLVFGTFDTDSAGGYAYLHNTVRSMLAGRLAAKDHIIILDHAVSGKEISALKKGATKGGENAGEFTADYLLSGALFSLKKGLNVQVTLYPFARGRQPLHFSFLMEELDNLIPRLEEMSREIAGKLRGAPVEKHVSLLSTKGIAGSGRKGFVTAHPEEAYKRGQYSGTIIAESDMIHVAAKGVKRTAGLDSEVSVMAVGDVSGDGEEEIIALSGSKLQIFRLQKRKILKVAQLSLPASLAVHAVNIANLDGDGGEKMYISATDGLQVSSMILSWSEHDGFRTIVRDVPWYLRPILLPGKGWILAGQRRGVQKTDLIRPGIYQLRLSGGEIKKVQRLALPVSINLFEFIHADLDGDGACEIVAIDQRDRIRVFDQNNALLWVSEKTFGGTKRYIGPNQGEATDEQSRTGFSVDENAERELLFIPTRLVAMDLNGDNRQEIMVGEHEKSSLNVFYRLRKYSGGAVVGLSWNGAAMQEVWRTGKFRGYMVGFDFRVLADGAKENSLKPEKPGKVGRIYVVTIPNGGTISSFLPGMSESLISVYDMVFTDGKDA